MADIDLLTQDELKLCIDLGKHLTSELNSDELFEKILTRLSDMIPADVWSLLLVDRETGELSFRLSVDLDIEKVRYLRLAPGEGIAGRAAELQKTVAVRDVSSCDFFSGKIDRVSGNKTESAICVPLIYRGETVGVIEAVNPYSWEEKSLVLLGLVADYAAIAVENTRRYHDIEMMAVHDNLTGLYNNRYLYQKLEELIIESRKSRKPFSLIFMDLDNFKRVVDTWGHLHGSQAIQEVASTIRETLHEPEFGVSYAGDEFVAVLPGYSKEDALAKAEIIRTAINETLYLTNRGITLKLSASFGVATYPEDSTQLVGIIGMADRAMFSVKGRGKNGVSGGE